MFFAEYEWIPGDTRFNHGSVKLKVAAENMFLDADSRASLVMMGAGNRSS
jgi:hypothetical protein